MHDYKWLNKTSKDAYSNTQRLAPLDVADACVQYHEHMKAKEAAAEAELLANAPEFTCTLCNYLFKGSASCKCGLRVTVAMRDAVILQYEQNINER